MKYAFENNNRTAKLNQKCAGRYSKRFKFRDKSGRSETILVTREFKAKFSILLK